MTEQAIEQIVFRAAHPIVLSLAPYLAERRVALVQTIVRLMLAAFLEEVAGIDGSAPKRRERNDRHDQLEDHRGKERLMRDVNERAVPP